eukprot:763856-Hanusia_phi.AAC.5
MEQRHRLSNHINMPSLSPCLGAYLLISPLAGQLNVCRLVKVPGRSDEDLWMIECPVTGIPTYVPGGYARLQHRRPAAPPPITPATATIPAPAPAPAPPPPPHCRRLNPSVSSFLQSILVRRRHHLHLFLPIFHLDPSHRHSIVVHVSAGSDSPPAEDG